MISKMSGGLILIVMAVGMIVGSCSTMRAGTVQQAPLSALELVSGIEQTREITLENNLTFALSRLFGVDDVVVLVSSRAGYETVEKKEDMGGAGGGARRSYRLRIEPGKVERTTAVIVVNSNVLTSDQADDVEVLRDQLRELVIHATGMVVGEGSADSVSVLFMPFAD